MLDKPQLRPFWPLLYVAWSDGDLSADELRAITKTIDDTPWLDPGSREELAGWLSPQEPPRPSQLNALLSQIKSATNTLELKSRCSLAELGLAIGGGHDDAPTRAALEELQEALGMTGEDAGGALLGCREPKVEEASETRFDPRAMQAVLDGEFVEARERARAFLSDPAHVTNYDLPYKEYREQIFGWLKELGEAGLGAIAYPGVTSDVDSLGPFMVTFETLGLGDLSLLVKYGVHYGLYGGSIYSLGSKRHHEQYLPSAADVSLPGCFAMTELGHGSNVMELETTATYDHATRELVIHTPKESARKEWIGNAAAHAQMASVFAQLIVDGESHGVHAVLVRIRDEHGAAMPGVRIGDCGHKLGLNGVDNGRLWFEQVRVPVDNLLDRFARVDENGEYESEIPGKAKRFFTTLGTLVGGRVSVAAGGVSASKVGVTIATRYAESRRQFGKPGEREVKVLDYPTHQRRLMPALAATYAMHFAVDHLRTRFLGRTEEDAREIEALAAGIKALATEHATVTLQSCREACGGQGYLSANRIGPLKSDTDVFTTFEGDNIVLLQQVAKALLTDFRKQFADSRVMGTLRFLANKASRSVAQMNPYTSRLTDEAHLRDRDFQLGLFRFRERQLVDAGAMRLQKRIQKTGDSFTAFLEVQNHIIAMARAHVEVIALEAFVDAVAKVEDPACKAALDRLCDLWALGRIEADLGWFMENGAVEASKAKAVRDRVDALCAEVRKDALPLCDAFGIPDTCLNAPIAFGDPAQRL